jgi:hypothetical protein
MSDVENENVVPFRGVTVLDIDADQVLHAAMGRLDAVVIAGYEKDGETYFASSFGSNADTAWLLEKFKAMLLEPRHE